MMKNAVLYGLFLCLWVCLGCAGEDGEPELGKACPVEAVEGPEDEVVGKWKMVWERTGFSNNTKDYSCNHIIYHFRPDGILEISGDVEAGHSVGVYNYELIWDPYNSGTTTFRGVKIGDFRRWACLIETTNMTLDLTPLDGPMRHFIRIQ